MQVSYIRTRKMTTSVIIGCSTPSRHNSFDVSNSPEKHDNLSGIEQSGSREELEKLRRERISSLFLIERYRLYITYAVIFGLFGIAFAVCMGAWKIMEKDPSLGDLRDRLLQTPREGPRICSSAYPNLTPREKSIEDVGERAHLTPLIDQGLLSEARDKSLVTSIMQTEVSYSGYLTVNKTTNANLFFWFFVAKETRERYIYENDVFLIIN
uniref:Probable serine carboxypeptidase CPVL n=1 Tax=Caligus clemensi TaxID=344056 RepID=C1C0F7_CALCM|nr:Probable serine carboxypeptidase CPVL precursor [Caligus clemensi]